MQRGMRIILYSHDALGQGLRRTSALAAALMVDDPTASALILTGSPLAGHVALPERVDHLRLPGVVKLYDGSCVAETLGLDIEEITTLRGSLIRSAVAALDPDLMIVDTEPAGFRGELLPALEVLIARRRARIVLGLGGVRGNRHVKAAKWERRNAVGTPLQYYDEIWVHGPHSFHDPTGGHRNRPGNAGAGRGMDGVICRKWRLRTMFWCAPAQQSAAE